MQWTDVPDPAFAIIGNRGPLGGIENPESITYEIHGISEQWIGNICFNDNHIAVSNSFIPKGAEYIDTGGKLQPDNIFRFDDGADGADAILSFTKMMNADGPELQHD